MQGAGHRSDSNSVALLNPRRHQASRTQHPTPAVGVVLSSQGWLGVEGEAWRVALEPFSLESSVTSWSNFRVEGGGYRSDGNSVALLGWG